MMARLNLELTAVDSDRNGVVVRVATHGYSSCFSKAMMLLC
jgi:hypothetical protein